MTTHLYVDTRWRGNFGIARYSREVLQRINLGWKPLGLQSVPGSPRDLLTPRARSAKALIYSPGYNAGPSCRTRQLVTVHDLIHLHEPGLKYRPYYEHILAPAIKKAGTVLTVSETSARELESWLPNGTRIVVTGNACAPIFAAPPEWQDPPAPTALFVGNLKPHKNVDVLLGAISELPEYQLTTVTPDPEALLARAAKFGVRDRTISLSGVSDDVLVSLYRQATVTVVPSLLEGFGLPALESCRSGTPVLYWRGCKSVEEIVGRNGFAVESPSDRGEWANALQFFAENYMETRVRSHPWPSWDDVGQVVNQVLKATIAEGQ